MSIIPTSADCIKNAIKHIKILLVCRIINKTNKTSIYEIFKEERGELTASLIVFRRDDLLAPSFPCKGWKRQ